MAVFWVVACVVWWKFTNISEVLAASIISVMSHFPDDGGSKDL
jgi:hypothetical protein